MPPDAISPRDALQALADSLGVAPEETLERADTLTLEDVRRFLILQIEALLNRNLSLLMHILYRVDVAERAVKEAFSTATPEELPGVLADLLIERQLAKLRTRRAYREKQEKQRGVS